MDHVRRYPRSLLGRHVGVSVVTQPDFPGIGAGVQYRGAGRPRAGAAHCPFEMFQQRVVMQKEPGRNSCEPATGIKRQRELALAQRKRLHKPVAALAVRKTFPLHPGNEPFQNSIARFHRTESQFRWRGCAEFFGTACHLSRIDAAMHRRHPREKNVLQESFVNFRANRVSTE